MKFTKKMKVLFAVAAVLLAAVVPACAAPGNPASGNSGNVTLNAKKVLVVYYSATGTTERLANIIAKETKADTFLKMQQLKKHQFLKTVVLVRDSAHVNPRRLRERTRRVFQPCYLSG